MNEENMLIIGDDLAAQPTIDQAIPVPNAPPGDGDGSWLAGRTNALAEKFLQEHQAEFQDYERRERGKTACAGQFHALQAELAARRQWLENLQKDIAEYQALDLGAEIFLNMKRTGRPLPDVAQSQLFSAVALVKQHGKKLLQLAEQETADLQEKFDAFKSANKETLKELGLV